MTIHRPCGICGDLVRSQSHLTTHSFVEVLRYTIRQDLDEVPDEQRPAIIRDIYRSLLGAARQRSNMFTLDATDGQGAYTIDEALGGVEMYRLWRSANACDRPACTQRETRSDALPSGANGLRRQSQ